MGLLERSDCCGEGLRFGWGHTNVLYMTCGDLDFEKFASDHAWRSAKAPRYVKIHTHSNG